MSRMSHQNMDENTEENSLESSFSLEQFNTELENCVCKLSAENDQIKFVIKEENNYTVFNRLLEAHGIAFSINKSSVKRLGKLQFSNKHLGIPYFGHPFRVKKTAVYDCVNGPRRDKYKKKNSIHDHPTDGKRRRNRSQSMRKIDCQATMSIKEIEFFPDYEVVGDRNIHDRKAECMKRLKEDLKSQQSRGEPVKFKSLYFVSMSDPLTHSHPFLTSLQCQQVDKDVVQEIKRLVIQEKISDIEFIKTTLQDFVKTHISTNIPSQARAFFPSKRTIYNFILKFRNEAKCDNSHQIVLQNEINDRGLKTEVKNDPEVIISDEASPSETMFPAIDDWDGYTEEVLSSETYAVQVEESVENLNNSETNKKPTLVEFRKNLEVLQNISNNLPACLSQSDELEEASRLLFMCQNILRSFLPADSNFVTVSNGRESISNLVKRKRRK